MKKLSVILPSYNEEGMISTAFKKINKLLKSNNISYEIIFVNDGSKDKTWQEILEVSSNNEGVRGINFSRNFGKEAAIRAGLQFATGDCAVVMDCDLQHPPETIIKMYNLWLENYQIVEGVKLTRGKENFLYKASSKLFYSILKAITGFPLQNSSDFKLLDRQVIEEFLRLSEQKTFFRAITFWLGFKSISVEYEVQEREIGTSKWSATSLIKYAFNNITSFSTAPMQIITIIGIINLLISLVIGIQSLVKYLQGDSLEGFTTVIFLLLLIGSSLMISLGIMGFYLAKIYDEVKGRQPYIIESITREVILKEKTLRKSEIHYDEYVK